VAQYTYQGTKDIYTDICLVCLDFCALMAQKKYSIYIYVCIYRCIYVCVWHSIHIKAQKTYIHIYQGTKDIYTEEVQYIYVYVFIGVYIYVWYSIHIKAQKTYIHIFQGTKDMYTYISRHKGQIYIYFKAQKTYIHTYQGTKDRYMSCAP